MTAPTNPDTLIADYLTAWTAANPNVPYPGSIKYEKGWFRVCGRSGCVYDSIRGSRLIEWTKRLQARAAVT